MSAQFDDSWPMLKLSMRWLVISLGFVFIVCLIFDVGILIFGPLAAVVIGAWSLGLLLRGAKLGWQLRSDRRYMAVNGLAMPSVMVLFGLLLFPTVKAGNLAQAWMYLGIYATRYVDVINNPRSPDLDTQRSLMLKIAGQGNSRIFSFGYGGFISMERAIVYDPLDRPESRSRDLFGVEVAQCEHLVGHYYDCFLE